MLLPLDAITPYSCGDFHLKKTATTTTRTETNEEKTFSNQPLDRTNHERRLITVEQPLPSRLNTLSNHTHTHTQPGQSVAKIIRHSPCAFCVSMFVALCMSQKAPDFTIVDLHQSSSSFKIFPFHFFGFCVP